MRGYLGPIITVCRWEEDCDVITLSIGTSNDNNYSDIDWELG